MPISPSGVESFLTCELNALLSGFGVDDRESSAADLGNVIHEIAANADDGQTLADLHAALDAAWERIDFAASWFADNEHAASGADAGEPRVAGSPRAGPA